MKTRNVIGVASLASAATLLAACAGMNAAGPKATATLEPRSGSKVSGTVSFQTVGQKVRVEASMSATRKELSGGRATARRTAPIRVTRRIRTARQLANADLAAARFNAEGARASLAAILLSRFDVMLLDEPTNDLDFAGLERLEAFVDDLPGGVVIVSHDRTFLERTGSRWLTKPFNIRDVEELVAGSLRNTATGPLAAQGSMLN